MAARKPRFLILRGGAIGDFIVTLPAIRLLRERWPDAHIELIGYPHIAFLADRAGLVDAVGSLDTARIARFFSLRPQIPDDQIAYIESFDVIISFLHDPDGTVKENLLDAGAKQVIYGSPIVTAGHAVDHLLKPLETLALYGQGAAPELPWPAEERERGRKILAGQGLAGRLLAIHPGSGSPKKNWPVERFVELARRAAAEGFDPFLLLGEADEAAAAGIKRLAPDLPRFENLPLEDVASVLANADRYLGNDSGITHLAAALGLPSVALFGPSDPARWAPRGARVRIVRAPGDMAGITADAAWEALAAL